ncbi:MAG: EAL domain-containing protein [Pseudomonadota bacterium]
MSAKLSSRSGLHPSSAPRETARVGGRGKPGLLADGLAKPKQPDAVHPLHVASPGPLGLHGLDLKRPGVAQLVRPVPPMPESATCLEALDRFHKEAWLWAIPVVDCENRPLGLIDRYSFVEFLSRLYARDLFGKRTLREMRLEHPGAVGGGAPVVVDAATGIDDVAQIIIGEGMRHMVSGFVVTQGGVYAGIVSGHDLLHEITRRKQADLYYLAHYDSLTEIPNRMLFTDRLTQACREAHRDGTQVALMFVDVDRFKQVNDSMGHHFGDLLLKGVVKRLQVCIRESDTLARLGGDEFAVLMDGLAAPEDAEILARRFIESMREPFTILDREIKVSLSIGIAVFPHDDVEVGVLLSKADAAMYEVKINGRNGYRRYTAGMSTYSEERLALETDLKRALDNQEFVLCYQPQICMRTGEVRGAEALIRWRHPTRGLLSPGSFIDIAEECGLIVPMGEWVLAEACEQQRIWREQGLPPLRMAVNISPLQFRQPDFAERVRDLLASARIDPGLLELELTEGMVMSNSQQVVETLRELQGLGVQLSLDDFGTGFSSLGYLRRFPINRLKIDQSFVRDVDRIPVNASIIRAIVALARSLAMEVVAEGVENEAELAVVRAGGCDESQGYFHARPMSAADFSAWLQRDRARETAHETVERD